VARHQYGIFTEGTRAHHHLELAVHEGASDAAIARALAATRATAADHRTVGGVALVISVGPDIAARLWPAEARPPLRPFPGYRSRSGRHEAPATQRDIWIWTHGPGYDALVDVVRPIVAAWDGVATIELDQPGFVYHDSRDLTGFIDGTANPFLDRAPLVATIPEGRPGAGGCCAMTERFRHDLDAFAKLAVHDQEQVFGRTKADSEELEGDDKPIDAHISRVEVDDDDGEELAVYRRSVPWATATEQGLHFVSFGQDLDRFDLQLRHQYGLVDDGVEDRLLDFTTPLTGSFWWTPSVEALDAVAPVDVDDD
jgi:putative iron-dependent peroxidase